MRGTEQQLTQEDTQDATHSLIAFVKRLPYG